MRRSAIDPVALAWNLRIAAAAVTLLFGVAGQARPPSAQPASLRPLAPASSAAERSLSDYERQILGRVLKEREATIDPNPEGKIIEAVDLEPLEVFEPDAWTVSWLNWFHSTSRDAVLRREILLQPGQVYCQTLVSESARNLRELPQLSLVLLVPVRGLDSRHVRLLVVTKDVWSLRLNSQYRIKNGKVEYLLLQPSEDNVAGLHLRLAGEYLYDLSTDTFGGSIRQARLLGSRLSLVAAANVIVHRSTGKAEGSEGLFYFGQPLYSSRVRWSWGTSLSWDNRVNRLLLPARGDGYVPRTYDAPSTPEDDRLPYEYRARQLYWTTFVTRSYGNLDKTQLSTGLEALLQQYNAQSLLAQGYSRQAVSDFERDELPHSDVRLGPFLMIESFDNRYVTLHDVETLGLVEDFRLGHHAFLKAYGASRRANATRNLLGIAAGLDYTLYWGGALARSWATNTAELTPHHNGNDAIAQAGLRLVSPPLGFGRLIYDGGAAVRYRNYRNLAFELGGDNRLRGYPSGQFRGSNLLSSNLEFRTRSVQILHVLFGLVAFYDVGDAFDDFRQIRPKQSLGLGGRATIPQLQRIVGRLDVSVPMTAPDEARNERWPSVDILLSLDGQAFPYPVTSATPLTSPLVGTGTR